MKKIFLTLLCLIGFANCWAYDYMDDNGMCYYLSEGYENGELVRIATVTYFSDANEYVDNAAHYQGSIVIPNQFTHEGYTYTVRTIGYNAFRNCNKLTSITLPETLICIDMASFRNCTGLTSIEIPDGVVTIDEQAFYECHSLENVSLPSNLTNLGSYAFYECGIESITLPSSLNNLGSDVFSGCRNLKNIYFSEGLKLLSNSLCAGCSSIEKIVIPESVTSIGDGCFTNCTSLLSAEIKGNVTNLPNNLFNGTNAIIKLASTTPATLGETVFSSTNTIIVPAGTAEAYQAAWTNYSHQIIDGGAQTDFVLTDVEAREDESQVLNLVNVEAGLFDAMLNVLKLKVSGTINSFDIMIIRNKMKNLHELDLSDARIIANSYPYYGEYCTEDNVIGPYTFYECFNLQSVKLPTSTKIIKHDAFHGCNNLSEIKFPKNLEEIDQSAFQYCYNLKNVEFSPNIKRIGSYAFHNCYKLEKINLPTKLQEIGYSAFSYCSSLKEVKIPASVKTIGDQAFYSGSITDIYTWTIQPTKIGQTTFPGNVYKTALVHVPEMSKKFYYWDTQWSQFLHTTTFNEPYEYFYIQDEDLTLEPETPRFDGVDDGEGNVKNPDADLEPGSGLIVVGDEKQNLGEVNLKSDDETAGSIIGGNSTTDANGANVHIDKLNIKIDIKKDRWYFFSFPYAIPYANIHFNGQFVWRYYDGEFRAEHGSGAWKNVDGALQPGIGYIFQGSKNGTLTITIDNADLKADNKITALQSHTAANAQDASWNLVGNPYTSFYEMTEEVLDAPITVWDGTKYVAYNAKDESVVLHPFQAFFLQKPIGNDDMTFNAADRLTNNQKNDPKVQAASKARRMARKARRNEVRELVNLELSDGATTDKTRVVFNEKSSMDYEMECDAAKFFTDGVPQLYTVDSKNTQYAINERPAGNGTVKLAYSASAAGTFTIAATRMDCEVVLRDLSTGMTHELSKGEYTFQTESGTFANRFELVKANAGATGIATAETTDGAQADYYNTAGAKVNKGNSGVLIVKKGQKAQKVVNK